MVYLEIESDLKSHHPVDSEFATAMSVMFTLGDGSLVIPPGEPSFSVFCELVPVCHYCLAEWLPGVPRLPDRD